MKIAFLLDTFPSLTESFIARDIAALRRRGLDIHIFALRSGAGARPLAASSPALSALNLFSKLTQRGERAAYFKALGAAWAAEIAAENFTQIHAGWASHPAYIAWGAAQKLNLPWSFSGHARDVFVAGGDLRGKIAAARGVAVCTRAAQTHLSQFGAAEKIIYAPHGIEVENWEFAPGNFEDTAGPPRLLCVGRLVEKKGFGVLLDALAVLRARGFACEVQIIGAGPLRATLEQRRDRLNLRECVHFRGALPQPEVIAAMRAAHCFVAPSINAPDGDRDGVPNVLLEAAACGLPIVATRAGAIEEFVSEDNGVLCRAGRAEELATAIETVFASPPATLQRCHAARQRVESDFDSFRNSAKLARLFEE